MPNILLIDDDKKLGELLSQYFERFSLSLSHALTPSEGFSEIGKHAFDLVILDVMLPEMDGFEVCKRLRKTSEIPIIMLTARGDVMDRVIGIELGADDYLPKPFEPRELVVRIQSILKRAGKTKLSPVIEYPGLSIDTELRQVILHGNALKLTSMEFNVLHLMAQHPNKVYQRDELLNILKGIDSDIYSRSIDILISRLRAKLKPEKYIQTIRGTGYCFSGKLKSASQNLDHAKQ